jgi:hypothetical protein
MGQSVLKSVIAETNSLQGYKRHLEAFFISKEKFIERKTNFKGTKTRSFYEQFMHFNRKAGIAGNQK